MILKRISPAKNRVWGDNKGNLWRKLKRRRYFFSYFFCVVASDPVTCGESLSAYTTHDEQNLSYTINCIYPLRDTVLAFNVKTTAVIISIFL